MMFFVPIFAIFALCVILCVYIELRRGKRLIVKIPGPKGWPIIGNALNYALPPDQLFIYIRSVYKTYGMINPVYAINMQAVNIYDPDDIEILMSNTRYNVKRIPYTFLRPWLCEGLLVSNGKKWQLRRKLLTKAFHFSILKKYMQTFTERAEVFLNRTAKNEGIITDILPLITETTLDVMCETTMGTSVTRGPSCKSNKYFEALHDLGEIVATRMSRVWLYFNFTYMLTDLYKMQNKLVKILHDFTITIIKERKEEHVYKDVIESTEKKESDVYEAKSHLAMLDLLLQNEKEGTIDLDGIREEVDTFMFEGHDTTAMAMSYFLLTIANEANAQDKIFEEIQSIFGDSSRSPTVEDLNKMKYLECCIKESLRLYPSVPFITRYLTEDITLSGYKVPVGTTCHIHIFDLHHNEKLFPDPEKFIPERFLPENSSQRHPYAYIPFSAGSRNCIGQKFAMMELKTFMSMLLRSYRLEPVTRPQDLVFRADLVLRTNHPIYVRFCARNGTY